MQIDYPETTLPVLRETDIAVVGGSLAGIATALRLAHDGRSVTLVEPRTYLGRDITATLRPWLSLPEQSDPASLPEPIRTILDAHDLREVLIGTEIPLHPDTIKRCLEDVLLAANVDLLYANLPMGLCETGLVIGNKSGRQVIRCRTIVDATETALVARLAGGTFEPPTEAPVRMSRTLEFDRVQPITEAALPVPRHLGIVGNAVRLHTGYRGAGHLLVECDLDLPYRPDLEGSAAAEFEAWRRSMRLVEHLVNRYPEFAVGRFASSSHELHGRWTPSLSGPLPEWASHVSGALISAADDDHAFSAPMSQLAGPVPNLWCLSEAARLDAQQATWFLDPVRAARLGERFAATLLGIGEGRDVSVSARHSAASPSRLTADADIFTVNVREPESPQRGRHYEREPVRSATVPVHRTTDRIADRIADVLVVGGGSSGATAAITAAREGMRTVLLDMNPGPGGTGTYGGVNSYWYGRHVGFAAWLEAAVTAQHASIRHTGGKWNIDAKTWVLLDMANDAGVESLFNAVAIAALTDLTDGNRVRGVVVATRWGPVAILAEVVIDATGDGDIAAFAGATFTYGAERTHSVMWYSLAQYASPGLIRNNFTSTVDISNIEDYTRAILAGRRRGDSTHDHGIYVATRESRHIRGSVTMTLTDQLRHRRWPDVINIHYSNHDIKGQTESAWLRSGLIPPNLEIEIPYRVVLPEGIDGLLVAGKAISVTHDGLPAVRMQADLENLGGVVALAAVQAVRTGKIPRDIDLPALQRRLVNEGMLPGEVLTRVLDEREHTDEDLEAFVAQLTGEAPLYGYSDMHMGELFRERIPFVEICSAGDRAVPILVRAHERVHGPRRLVLAQALAICGSGAGVPTLIDAIASAISDGLPERDSNIRHAGFPPDQGAMPDVVYLLFSLGMVPDERSLPVWERVVALLNPTPENLRDRFSGTFSYVDAVCHAADRSCDPAMIPLLERLHAHGPLRDQVCRNGFQPDFFEERGAMLELGVARALARCGSREGFNVLVVYLDDVRALLAERAHSELIDLTGGDHGKDASAWTGWLESNQPTVRPAPPVTAVLVPV
jgi:ribulose 1,5-bisphosphate synthetase/thiazole synthase